MDLASLRHVGIAAHIDAGKTTVSERFLYYAGVEHRMGEVHEGTAVMDWMDEERRRGITITAAATTFGWREHSISLIDTPGHVDFTVEVERCMRVLDGAILVLSGVSGVEAQTETVWQQIRKYEVPCLGFINQCDRAGADVFRVAEEVEERLGIRAVPVQYPVGEGREFRSVVDLIARQMLVFGEGRHARTPERTEVPSGVLDEVEVLRAELVDVLVDADEALMELVLEEREPTPDDLRAALRRCVLRRQVLPLLAGAALRNVGIQPLLDAVVDYLPSPLDRGAVAGRVATAEGLGAEVECEPSAEAPTCALVFKLAVETHDELAYVRLYSGELRPGQNVFNPRVERKERIARVLRMHADSRQALDVARAGEIVAVTGLKFSVTGDSLCDPDHPVALERLDFPEPVITRVVEPATAGDRDRLIQALGRLGREDPTLRAREDEETGQWLIEGMGELHLEVVQHRLRDDFHAEVQVGQPRVAYREAVSVSAVGAGRVERALGGKDLFGAVALSIEPAPDAGPPAVAWGPDTGIPAAMHAAVEEALLLASSAGPRFGFPLIRASIRVTGGESEPARDSEMAFAQAASAALREALAGAGVELLEPIMALELRAPEEFLGGIIADLNSRRADITDVRAEGAAGRVTGRVPLAHMFGYTTLLRSLSQGRASCTLTPSGYRPVPEDELEARGLVWR